MDGNTNQLSPDNSPAPTLNKQGTQPAENNQSTSKKHKKPWLIIGIIVAATAAVGVIVGALAMNGVFKSDNRNDEDKLTCPEGEHVSCGVLSGGIKRCHCTDVKFEALKPIIYLYPEKETEVSVRLGAPEKLTSSYPKYTDGWNVIAYPDGTLIDKSTGNKLYSLYWEGQDSARDFDRATGFVVRGEDSIEFLEEKLDILGLNFKEREEFIVYWLPKLEANKYNYIYFETKEEIDTEMPLDFSVQPDTIIRIRMAFEGLDEYKEVEEQSLAPVPERKGFTVVEWGGTDLSE